jgi:hypothetical protein
VHDRVVRVAVVLRPERDAVVPGVADEVVATFVSVIGPAYASRLMPSAVVSWIRRFVRVRFVLGPVIQTPTFSFWIQTSSIFESLKPPLNAVTSVSLSSRTSTLPYMDRLETSTFVLAGFCWPLNSTLLPVSTVYHSPAPSTFTLFTFSGALIV